MAALDSHQPSSMKRGLSCAIAAASVDGSVIAIAPLK
jgi:hypothetical protein